MANSKNTIQQIPLTGNLNMNTLKTEVKQFEGYNEKNSTVFGGTLSPFYDKKTEIGISSSSTSVCNSKGDLFRIRPSSSNGIAVYKNDDTTPIMKDGLFPFYTKLDIPTTALWGTQIRDSASSKALLYVENKTLYGRTVQYSASKKGSELPWTSLYTFSFVPAEIEMIYDGTSISSPFGYETAIIHAVGITTITDSDYKTYNVLNTECVQISIDSYNNTITKKTSSTSQTITTNDTISSPISTIIKNSGTIEIYSISNSGVIKADTPTPKVLLTTFSKSSGEFAESGEVTYYKPETPSSSGTISYSAGTCNLRNKNGEGESNVDYVPSISWGDRSYEIYQYSFRACYAEKVLVQHEDGTSLTYSHPTFSQTCANIYGTSVNGTNRNRHYNSVQSGTFDGIIPSPVSSDKVSSKLTTVYYQNGVLIGLETLGMQVPGTLQFNSSVISYYGHSGIIYQSFTYKTNEGWCQFELDYVTSGNLMTEDEMMQSEKWMIIEDSYILFPNILSTSKLLYDIETETYVKDCGYIGYIDTYFPSRPEDLRVITVANDITLSDVSLTTGLTGAIYGSGFNAGYADNGANFVGYLPNPFVLSYVPDDCTMKLSENPVQRYCTLGNSVESASYVGNDSTYNGTYYAIDSNSNILIPICYCSDIIKGYSNNSLITIGSTSYPLVYNNVNTQLFDYYMLSFMENIEGAFSLQGQSYTFDAENIYATTYESGIIQSASPVCYKNHMRFMGTLPTQAIFWSDFNKTFYSFTGDRILSKMFEASDINEIYYVGQNPASLSLWICTDKGIYVMSDTDMYRLNYVTDQKPYFTDKYAIITMIEDDKLYENDISLYDIGNSGTMVPVKLTTAYYGIGNEQKAVMDCWYIRLFDENKSEGDVKVKVHTVTDISRHTEEKTFHISPSDYDENNIVYLRYQPKYQECTAMQLELESPIGIYSLALGVNGTDTVAQISKFNF